MFHKNILRLIFLACLILLAFSNNCKTKPTLDCEFMVCDTINSYSAAVCINDTIVQYFPVIYDPIKLKYEKDAYLIISFWQCDECWGKDIVNIYDKNDFKIDCIGVNYYGNVGLADTILLNKLFTADIFPLHFQLTKRKKIVIGKIR